MQERIEPPVLLSRLLIFVFAGMVVVLFVLVLTMQKMFPLNRPEIFFLDSIPANNNIVQLTGMPPVGQNLDNYKQAFVMEYVRARNEVDDNLTAVRQKWGNERGVVALWSTPSIYKAFTNTKLYGMLALSGYPDFEIRCPVDFIGVPRSLSQDKYTVKINYSCITPGGQTETKSYVIRVGLTVDENAKLSWNERLNNPLGLKVSEYVIESNNGDPLNGAYIQ